MEGIREKNGKDNQGNQKLFYKILKVKRRKKSGTNNIKNKDELLNEDKEMSR